MASTEKQVSYQASNSYSTLNSLTDKTKNVWIACHGLGYLSRYFIGYFKQLNPQENYIISPQAPSKYYQDKKFKYVGASWLTREDTHMETANVLRYLDAILEAETIPEDKNLILFGYSQGVSVITRWLASRKTNVTRLVLHSGGIPKELTPQDFSFLSKTKVSLFYGTKDEYLNEKRIEEERKKAQSLFGKYIEITSFDGKHEVNRELIRRVAEGEL